MYLSICISCYAYSLCTSVYHCYYYYYYHTYIHTVGATREVNLAHSTMQALRTYFEDILSTQSEKSPEPNLFNAAAKDILTLIQVPLYIHLRYYYYYSSSLSQLLFFIRPIPMKGFSTTSSLINSKRD